MTEYICARWRDAVTDPPEPNRIVLLRDTIMGWITAKRVTEKDGLGKTHTVWRVSIYRQSALGPRPGDQWLDVTDIPAIPREKVQAAVDEMQSKANAATLNTPQEIAAIGIRGSIGCIAHHTGITPTEVDCGTSVERVLTEIEIDSFAVTP